MRQEGPLVKRVSRHLDHPTQALLAMYQYLHSLSCGDLHGLPGLMRSERFETKLCIVDPGIPLADVGLRIGRSG